MRISLFVLLALVGCSAGGGATDAGTDGGRNPIEGDCTNVPDRLTAVNCIESTTELCAASASAMRAAHPGTCDANGSTGGVATLSCGGFEVVAHTSAVTTVECFYVADGGGLSGALNFADTSIGAWGEVADCNRAAPVACSAACGPFPPHVTQATCVDAARFANCESMTVPVVIDCDAAHGNVGYAAEGSCGDVNALRWTYAQTGDTRECFYAADGGAFVGALDFTDRGVFANGTTASCTWELTVGCRDGGP